VLEAGARVLTKLVAGVGARVLTKVVNKPVAGVGARVSTRFLVKKTLPLVRSKLA